jgi:hypothetical protein
LLRNFSTYLSINEWYHPFGNGAGIPPEMPHRLKDMNKLSKYRMQEDAKLLQNVTDKTGNGISGGGYKIIN